MSALISKIELHIPKAKAKRISEEVVIGKDILELLTGAMYVDPLNVYREYIQNAADSIDEIRLVALQTSETPDVEIIIDHQERSVRIRDFGASVPSSDFVRRLTAIGASGKRGTKQRGFRGVGRLSGLGYCQELIFRGRQNEKSAVMELRWDARALRDRLRDPSFNGRLSDLVQEIATISELPPKDWPSRFFEVELNRVIRLRNDVLLNEDAVRGYLAQVAPVPFDPEFSFGADIEGALTARGISAPLRIELNDGKGLVYHRACEKFPIKQNVHDVFRSIDFWEMNGPDGQPAAFGWILDHSYFGALPKKLGLGGIRLRAGNIQVGDQTAVTPLFSEQRLNEWAVGEIHILSTKILPNGRRDDFEPSMHYSHLQGEIATKAKEIVQRIRTRSDQRSRLHRINIHFQQAEAWTGAAERSRLHKIIRNAAIERAKKSLQQASNQIQKLAPNSSDAKLARKKLTTLESRLPTPLPKDSRRHPSDGAIEAAVNAILASEQIPKESIELASRVVRAIKKA